MACPKFDRTKHHKPEGQVLGARHLPHSAELSKSYCQGYAGVAYLRTSAAGGRPHYSREATARHGPGLVAQLRSVRGCRLWGWRRRSTPPRQWGTGSAGGQAPRLRVLRPLRAWESQRAIAQWPPLKRGRHGHVERRESPPSRQPDWHHRGTGPWPSLRLRHQTAGRAASGVVTCQLQQPWSRETARQDDRAIACVP